MKVCVDPGHGMSNRSPGVYDPGAVHAENGTLFKEADIALKYGLALKEALKSRGIDVFMTRDDETDVAPVTKRAGAATAAGCDLFISIHMNAFESDEPNGTETLYRDEEDRAFASRIQHSLVSTLSLKDKGLKHRPELAVLKFNGPAVLMELGFIGNDKDRNTILQPHIREAACKGLADVVQAHFSQNAAGAAVASHEAATAK